MTEIILDVDTGVDDALAILFAVRHPNLHLRAISCVAGNTDVDQVVANTLRVLDAAGAGDVPVARGAITPLIATLRHARDVHGEDGIGDTGLPRSSRIPKSQHAVEMLRNEILAAPEPVTLVTLAPLTNIALLLRTYPEVKGNVGKVVTMGGTTSAGNATAVAEFNVWHDPEAAAIVFGSGLPLTMYGLDVFYGVTVPTAKAQELAASAEPGANLAGRLLLHLSSKYGPGHRLAGSGACGIGDAGALCAAIDPGGLTTKRMSVSVELTGNLTRGQTVADARTVTVEHSRQGMVDVAIGIDGSRYRDLFLSTILQKGLYRGSSQH